RCPTLGANQDGKDRDAHLYRCLRRSRGHRGDRRGGAELPAGAGQRRVRDREHPDLTVNENSPAAGGAEFLGLPSIASRSFTLSARACSFYQKVIIIKYIL